MMVVLMFTTFPAARLLLSRRVSACLLVQPRTPTTAKSNSRISAIDAGHRQVRALSLVELPAPAATLLQSQQTPNASSFVKPLFSPHAGMARTSILQTIRLMSPTAKDPVLMEVVLARPHTPSSFRKLCTRLCGMSTSSPIKPCGPLMALLLLSTP